MGKIGQNGQYATTSVTQPETTIVFPDTLLPNLRFYIKVTSNYGFVAYDSMNVQVFIDWKQLSASNSFVPLQPANEIVFNNQLICLCNSSLNPNKLSVWASSNGTTWTQLSNSIPFYPNQKLLLTNFNNEIWDLSDN